MYVEQQSYDTLTGADDEQQLLFDNPRNGGSEQQRSSDRESEQQLSFNSPMDQQYVDSSFLQMRNMSSKGVMLLSSRIQSNPFWTILTNLC